MLWPARAALLAIAFLLVCWIQIDRWRRRYAVTNKRVSVEYGIISRVSNEVRIQDIRSINLRKTGLSGLLGIGRVEFSSAATDDAELFFGTRLRRRRSVTWCVPSSASRFVSPEQSAI
jgi:uncharacterized membrane protein YdbT with pleckstrin-like domain